MCVGFVKNSTTLVQTSFQLDSVSIYFNDILVHAPNCVFSIAHASGDEAASR